MEEAIVDDSPDLNLPPSEPLVHMGGPEMMFPDNQDQEQSLVGTQLSPHTPDQWLQNRAARVEQLRLRVAAGTYRIDSARLALGLLRNSTHFLENQ